MHFHGGQNLLDGHAHCSYIKPWFRSMLFRHLHINFLYYRVANHIYNICDHLETESVTLLCYLLVLYVYLCTYHGEWNVNAWLYFQSRTENEPMLTSMKPRNGGMLKNKITKIYSPKHVSSLLMPVWYKYNSTKSKSNTKQAS